MGIRAITGYVAHAVLLVYWLWVVASTAPELRRGTRDHQVKVRVLAIKTAGFVLTAVLVGIIHYWATAWWQVAVAVPVAVALAVLLRREYRRTVAAPRHRLTLAGRRRKVRPHRPAGTRGVPQHLRTDAAAPAPVARLAD